MIESVNQIIAIVNFICNHSDFPRYVVHDIRVVPNVNCVYGEYCKIHNLTKRFRQKRKSNETAMKFMSL